MTASSGRNLSDYWRIDSSDIRMREMASVLGGASAIASFLGSETGVQWVGEDYHITSGDLVGVEADLLSGIEPPFPGRAVDRLMGRLIGDIGRRRWSLPVEKVEGWRGLDRIERDELRRVYGMLEDTYSCRRFQEIFPVLGEYMKAAKPALPGSPEGLPGIAWEAEFPRDFVIHIWESVSLSEADIPSWFPEALEEAALYFVSMKQVYEKENRQVVRLRLAEEVFHRLRQYPRGRAVPVEWYADMFRESLAESSGQTVRHTGSGQDGIMEDLWTPQLLSAGPGEWERAPGGDRDEDGEDITRMLNRIGNSGCLTRIKNADFDRRVYNETRALVEREIRQVQQFFDKITFLESRWRYGRKSGKIDGRRLTRAGAGKTNVFKMRDIKDKSSLGVLLVMDVSASMNQYRLEVQKTACIFSEALRPLSSRLWFEVITYTGKELYLGSDVQLSRLASPVMPLSLNNIWVGGGTPTAEALGAGFLLLQEKGLDRNLIIHFTDGHSRREDRIALVLDRCARFNTDVITISVKTRQEDLYGKNRVEVINEVSELPNAVTGMLTTIFRH